MRGGLILVATWTTMARKDGMEIRRCTYDGLTARSTGKGYRGVITKKLAALAALPAILAVGPA